MTRGTVTRCEQKKGSFRGDGRVVCSSGPMLPPHTHAAAELSVNQSSARCHHRATAAAAVFQNCLLIFAIHDSFYHRASSKAGSATALGASLGPRTARPTRGSGSKIRGRESA